MNQIITKKQLQYSSTAFILSTSLLTKTAYMYAHNQAWITVLISTAFSWLLMLVYGRIVRNHPGIGLLEINKEVFGTVVGKAVSALYVFYIFSLVILNTHHFNGFVMETMLPDTPLMLVYVVFVACCIFGVRMGISALTRCGALMTFGCLAAFVINGVLMGNIMYPENLLPVFTIPIKNHLYGAHLISMLPFCEIFLFLVFGRQLPAPAETNMALKRGFFVAAGCLMFIVLRDVLVLGEYVLIASFPTFLSIRMINVGDILTRLEIVYAVTLIALAFFKVAVLQTAMAHTLAEFLHVSRAGMFALVIGVLTVVASRDVFGSFYEHARWFTAAGTYSSFFLILLPVVTLVVSEIRRRGGKKAPPEAARAQS